MTIVTDLRCEHLVSPLGVETLSPRLSWRLETDRRGARQTARRVQVASRPGLLAQSNCTADLWDSGRVQSDDSVLVPYAGRRLRSRQRCWWRVCIWDETGTEAVSEPAWWEMGLLRAEDWRARWIAADLPKTHVAVPASPLLRKSFRLDKPIVAARAYVCGLGFYELRLNGRKVGDAVLHPAFTRYDVRALYTVHDIGADLLPGANAVGIMLGHGWYNHHAQDAWNFFAASWRDEPKALVQLEIQFSDGQRKTIVSDDSWRCASGPIVFDGLRNGERYDARAEKDGWDGIAYRDSAWPPARITRPPGGQLRAQLMPPCRVTETCQPASVCEIRPGVRIHDLGRNIAGWARLHARGPVGATIRMRYAEKLGEDGDIDPSNINSLIKSETFQTDVYILREVGGEEVWEPRFTYHGFQFVQVTVEGADADAVQYSLEGRVVNTDLERVGNFECSSELANRIQRAVIASTLGNYHGMPTDCPHREKNGWTGDAHLSAEQVLYNFEPSAAYAKWLDDFADCQRPSGALPAIVPTGGWGYNWGSGPAWDSAYILIPWYLYLYRGDMEILRRHYGGMQRYLGFLDSLATGYIIRLGLGDWCPPTPGPESHKTPAELTNTAYYHADARIVARVAALLGKQADARRYEALANKIKVAARKRFYDSKTGRLAGHSQTAIATFLYQGLCEPDETDAFRRMLLDEVASAGEHIDCGILGAKYVPNVLTELGDAEMAWRIVDQRDYPGWGLWIEQGATTLWESWDGTYSRNHHMFSDVSAWFYKTLAGIRPDPEKPGFKHAIVKPWPVGDLSWVTAETRTPFGRLNVAWRRENGRFRLEVEVPPNSTATIFLPTADTSTVRESGNPVKIVPGIGFCGIGPSHAAYTVGAGRYCFECIERGA